MPRTVSLAGALSRPVVKAIVDVVRHWKEVAMSNRELAAFGEIIADMASDLRLSPSELRALAAKGRNAANELPFILTALHIDERKLARHYPLVLCDLQRGCTMCAQKRRCNADIGSGVLAKTYKRYCVNTYTLRSLTLDDAVLDC
jgi:hypothetical protein